VKALSPTFKVEKEFILNVSKNRRNHLKAYIHCGFFDDLWDEVGLDQSLVKEIRGEVTIGAQNHSTLVAEVVEFIQEQRELHGLKSFRLAAGKHINSKFQYKYDNLVDIDLSKVISNTDEAQLKDIINYFLRHSKIINGGNDSWKLNTDPIQQVGSTQQLALTDSKDNTLTKTSKTMAQELPDVEM